MTIFPGPPRHALQLRGDKAGELPASHPSRIAATRWRRFWAKAALLVFMVAAAPLSAALAQTTPTVSVYRADQPAATAPAADCANGVVVPYAGQGWCIDPALGPVQGVVTSRTVDAGGVTLRGIVFLEDDGGWRAAGPFVDPNPNNDLIGSGVNAELKFVVAGQ